METTITPTLGPADALLAGAILEEYRGLLEVPETLETAGKKKPQPKKKPRPKKDERSGSHPCCIVRNSCRCSHRCKITGSHPCLTTGRKAPVKPGQKKKAESWNDLPRA